MGIEKDGGNDRNCRVVRDGEAWYKIEASQKMKDLFKNGGIWSVMKDPCHK